MNPQNPDILLLAIPRLEVHEHFAEEVRCSQPRLGDSHGIFQENLRLEELVKEGKDDSVETLVDLVLIFGVEGEVWPEDDTLEMGDCGVSDFAGCV